MRKMIFLLTVMLATVGMMGLCSCKGCAKTEKQDTEPAALYHDYDGVVQNFTAGVSYIQSLHRQTMFSLMNGGKYEWRNSRVLFNDVITAENIDDVHIVAVNDVFYYWDEHGPWVQYINSHVKYGVQIPWPINDVWIEDSDMSFSPIKVSCEDALQRLKEWNGVLPSDCDFIILRLPVGPKACNPQWTFGNTRDVVFIDAVTGEVRDSNPAFSRQ